jgi:hypothetical protein
VEKLKPWLFDDTSVRALLERRDKIVERLEQLAEERSELAVFLGVIHTRGMRIPTRPATALLLWVALWVAPAGAAGADDPCNVQAPRVVAVGDVHGAYDNFVQVLQMAGLVDDDAHWVGGTTHLVQTGDVLDRGQDAPKVLDLLMRLEKEAKKAGGRVHPLLGNHEVTNILGDYHAVNPAEYESFRTRDSMRRIRQLYRDVMDWGRDQARAAGREFDKDAYRKVLEVEAPLGYVERVRAFGEQGKYGRWLRRLNTVVRVNGVVFLHGGLTPEVAALGCQAINETVRRELTRDLDDTQRDPPHSLTMGANGPLWYRGLAREDETAHGPSVEKVLELMEAKAVIVAHSVTKTGRIQERFGGRVILIDVGMSPSYTGSLAALEIAADGAMTALYPDTREAIGPPMEPPSAAVAARP